MSTPTAGISAKRWVDWMDAEMGVPERSEDIWSFVYPSELGIWPGDDGDDNYYVYLEANCGWE